MPSHPASVLLVSQSPRRAQLLGGAGWRVHALAAHTREDATGATPELCAMAIAKQKMAAIAGAPLGALPQALRAWPRVAADTLVVLGDTCLGKPQNPAQAHAMLRALSGVAHRVVTGVVVQHPAGPDHAFAVSTQVQFRTLTDAELHAYVATGEPFDKAGGYGIQGLGSALVHAVHGSLTNVIGLPLQETLDALGGGP